jgi:hypothetical protein
LGWTKEKGLWVMMFNDKLGQTQVEVEQKDLFCKNKNKIKREKTHQTGRKSNVTTMG